MFWCHLYMLETYPWYIVYGCYGSFLEAHICDSGISYGIWYDASWRYIVVHDLDS
jgi:hypothetical protein